MVFCRAVSSLHCRIFSPAPTSTFKLCVFWCTEGWRGYFVHMSAVPTKRALHPLQLKDVTGSCESLDRPGSWEPNWSPLQERCQLLNTLKPSVQPDVLSFQNSRLQHYPVLVGSDQRERADGIWTCTAPRILSPYLYPLSRVAEFTVLA